MKIKLTRYFIVLFIIVVDISVANSARYIKNEAFGYGERLEYRVGMISGPLKGLGGSGGISINKAPLNYQISSSEKKDCYEINFWVNSEGIVDMTYPVHDRYRTILDVDGIFPYEFNQRIREGKYKKDFKATFDQVNHFAKVGDKQYKVDEYIQDILSALFYFRTMDLSKCKIGDVIVLNNFYKDSTFSLPVKIIGKETIKVPAGKFKTIQVQPGVSAGSLFKFEGNINVWLTDDIRKIPVKVATSIFIGDVGAELYKYSGVRGKIDAKIE